MRPAVLPSSVVILLIPVLALAYTWVVDPGGGGDSPNIGYAMEMASAGDTVLVTPGTYHESVTMKDEVVLTSSAGRDATTLEAAGFGVSTMRCVDLVNGATISGFKIIHGGMVVPRAGIECLRSSVSIFVNKF